MICSQNSELTDQAITTHYFIQKIEKFVRIEKLIEIMSVRRNRPLHEIELRRELFARRLQEAADNVSARDISSPRKEVSQAAE